ncbi:MAG: SRPBCC family protein [Pseudomonadales bacterium]
MTDTNESLGSIERVGNTYRAKLERLIAHPPSTVWAMLTDPAKFVDWLAPGEIELRNGGAAKLNFVDSGIVIDSTVTAFEPERLLEYSWSGPGEPERPVRYEIEPAGSETRLILTLTTPVDEDVARSCAGWEAHLMMLLAAIEGVPIRFPFERFQATRAEYNKQLNG